MLRRIWTGLVGACVLVAAQAEERGATVISGDFSLSAQRYDYAFPDGEDPEAVWAVDLRPAFDRFFGAVSVGGQVSVGWAEASFFTQRTLAIAPRVGVLVPLGTRTAFWPRAGLELRATSLDVDDGTTIDGRAVTLQLFAPLVLELAPHFFAGVGPTWTRDLWATFQGQPTGERSFVGAQSVIGGWF
jgi:hypothetical protein